MGSKDKLLNKELKFYEKIGVLKFKRLILKLVYQPFRLFGFSKEYVDSVLQQVSNNYFIGQRDGIKSLKKFKYSLLFNASIHTSLLIINVPHYYNLLNGNYSFLASINVIFGFTLNSYCIMLQRYNQIRINKVIKRYEKVDFSKREKLKNKITSSQVNRNVISYKLVNNSSYDDVDLDELVKNANLNQLKILKESLESFREEMRQGIYYKKVPYENKTLLLEKKDTFL